MISKQLIVYVANKHREQLNASFDTAIEVLDKAFKDKDRSILTEFDKDHADTEISLHDIYNEIIKIIKETFLDMIETNNADVLTEAEELLWKAIDDKITEEELDSFDEKNQMNVGYIYRGLYDAYF